MSNVKPWAWALPYVAVFIAYGLAYLVLSHFGPHSFHQPAVALEPRYQAEQKAVSHILLEDLRDIFRTGAEQRKEVDGYMARADSVTLDEFEIDSRGLVHIAADVEVCDFEMACGSQASPAWSYRIAFRATGQLDPIFKIAFEIDDVWAKNDRIWFHYPTTRPAISDDAVTARIARVIGSRSALFGFTSDVFILKTPRASQELAGLIEEMRGRPTPDTGEFALRMFHLSATTITTTGYGDIIPLTSTARILTGSEALAGPLLLGLFIYSLAIHRRSAAPADDLPHQE